MRQVPFLQGKRDIQENCTDRMKVKIDSDGPRDDHAPLCNNGTDIWQLARQQAIAPLYAVW